MLRYIEYLTLPLLTLALLMACIQFAHAGEKTFGDKNKYKPKEYDRPYGRSLDNDYQEDYHAKRRVGKEGLFTQDLYEEGDIYFRQRNTSFDDNQSYMLPPNKKTIPTWGKQR